MATGLSTSAVFSSGNFQVSVDFTQTYNSSTGKSTISITGVWVKSYGYYGYKYYPDGYVRIGGTYFYMDSYTGTHNVPVYNYNTWAYIRSSSGTKFTGKATVTHDKNGYASVQIGISMNFYTTDGSGGSGWGVSNYKTYSTSSTSNALSSPTIYKLTLNPGSGSSISVNRTSSTYANITAGSISSGANLYAGDKLSVTYTPNANYEVLTATVNGTSVDLNSSSAVTKSYTVSSNMVISTTARPLASDVAIQDGAEMMSDTVVTITSYASGYTHTLYYTLYDPGGTAISEHNMVLIEDGLESTDESLEVQYIWTVPNFYSAMKTYSSATCEVTCVTYNGDEELGLSTASFEIVLNTDGELSPSVTYTIEDTNSVSTALTGDSSILVLGVSVPECTIEASAKNEAVLVGVTVHTSMVEINDNSTSVTYTESFPVDKWNESDGFLFSATDSRGFITSVTAYPSIIEYVYPTINASVVRAGSTTGRIQISVDPSDYYYGLFGTEADTLNKFVLEYRYRSSSSSSWSVDDDSDSSGWRLICDQIGDFINDFGGSVKDNIYQTVDPIVIGEDGSFPYNQSYIFQVRVTDSIGTSTSGAITVRRGIPVFDWGENDFNFNVPVTMPSITVNGQTLSDITDDINDVRQSSAVTLDNSGKVTAIGGNEIAHPTLPSTLSAFSNDASFISYKLLWTNPNQVDSSGTYVGFSATSLTSSDFTDNLSNYKLFIFVYRMNSTDPKHITTVHFIPETGSVYCESSHTRGDSGYRYVRQRSFTINRSSNTVSFGSGIYTDADGSQSNTAVMVPLYIIGVRLP